MTRKKLRPDGSRVPRAVPAPRPEPDAEALSALERLTDTFPAPLRAFRDLGLLGAGRRWRLEQALARRTRSFVLAIHGVHDPHNQAAVLRTAEAFGVQEVHVVRHEGTHFSPARGVTKDAHKWLDVVRHADFDAVKATLSRRGMQVLAAALRDDAAPLYEVDFTKPTAVVFGNEAEGLPDEVVDACDSTVVIPMYGLTQSLNISVAAAVVTAHAIEMRRQRWGAVGDLSEEEKMALRIEWYRTAAAGRVPPSLAAALDRMNPERHTASTSRKENAP